MHDVLSLVRGSKCSPQWAGLIRSGLLDRQIGDNPEDYCARTPTALVGIYWQMVTVKQKATACLRRISAPSSDGIYHVYLLHKFVIESINHSIFSLIVIWSLTFSCIHTSLFTCWVWGAHSGDWRIRFGLLGMMSCCSDEPNVWEEHITSFGRTE